MRNYSGHGWEGKKYNRDMSVKEIAKTVRKEIKAANPDCKFSVRMDGYNALRISLLSGPFDAFLPVPTENTRGLDKFDYENWVNGAKSCHENGYRPVNHYQFGGEHDEYEERGGLVTKEVWECMRKVATIVQSYNYDDSDSMTDYFDTNFYFSLSVGKWDKPYTKTERRAA